MFEYNVVSRPRREFSVDKHHAFLREMDREGWELVSALHVFSERGGFYVFYFKREVGP